MFKKLVAIEPVSLVKSVVEKLNDYAQEVIFYDDLPHTDEEIIKRIGDADGVLVSYTTNINKTVLDACKNIRYIGMCCSLYAPESANVDIRRANELGIVVYGVRDYGDDGVVEYVLSELIRYLHGFGDKQWQALPLEINDLKVGIVGLGTTGIAIADALQFLGANVHYYSRTRKPEQEVRGIQYRPFHDLLSEVDVVFSCLNKNVILFDEKAFETLSNGKIFFNTSIGPSHESNALHKWVDEGSNEFFCDSQGALGEDNQVLLSHPHVNAQKISSGRTKQAFDRLSEKVLENIERYFVENQ